MGKIIMFLNESDLKKFDEDGYLFFPKMFNSEEASLLKEEADKVYREDRKEVWKESSGVARTAFAAHKYNEAFKRLAAHPRLIDPVSQVLEGDIYMHQFKLNAKAAFDGAVWQWHQDYGTWFNDDLMPTSRAMNVAIFLDDVTEFNGPLLFIPGSHKKGVIEANHDLTTTSYPLWTINNKLITELVDRAGGQEGGIVSPKGKAGSMIVFHSCLVHASSNNLSPFNRVSVYLSLCAVSNHIKRYKRKEYIAHRDFTPIECLPDDCLIKDYQVNLPWEKEVPESAFQTSLDETQV